ncbi:MAG TPA: hypothetical protein VGC99_17325, partial [Candidatus Tectomicrobia bacterium]
VLKPPVLFLTGCGQCAMKVCGIEVFHSGDSHNQPADQSLRDQGACSHEGNYPSREEKGHEDEENSSNSE